MKKLFAILSLLLFFFLVVGSDAGILILRSRGECDGYLVCQNFEGTGYDNEEVWTEVGDTIDPDEAVTVLRGSQSLEMDKTGSTPQTWLPIAATDPLYGFLRFRVSVDESFDVVNLQDSGSNQAMRLYRHDPTNYLRVFCGTNWSEGSTTLTQNITYYCYATCNYSPYS